MQPMLTILRAIQTYNETHTAATNAARDLRVLLEDWLGTQPNREEARAWLTSQPFEGLGVVMPPAVLADLHPCPDTQERRGAEALDKPTPRLAPLTLPQRS